MRRAWLAGLALVGALAAPAVARADAPIGRVALLAGLRATSGELGERFDLGGTIGVEAGYIPDRVGVVWTVLFTRHSAAEGAPLDDALDLTELGAALRVRVPLTVGEELAAFIQAGGELGRASLPVPPTGVRSWVAPAGALGIEWTQGDYVLGAAARFAALGDGPLVTGLMLSVGAGSR